MSDWNSPERAETYGLRLRNALFGGGAAALCLVGACNLYRDDASVASLREELAELPVVTAADLDRHVVGEDILLEGRLSGPVAEAREGLVVWVSYVPEVRRSSSRNSSNYTVYVQDEKATPAFQLAQPEGAVPVRASRYSVQAPSLRSDIDADEGGPICREDHARRGRAAPEPQLLCGLRQDQPVTVRGRVRSGSQGKEVEPSMVYGGSRADLLSAPGRTIAWLFIGVLVATSLGLAVFSVHQFRQFQHAND